MQKSVAGSLLIGVDYGAKRIGLAVNDALGLFASPWGQIDAGRTLKATAKILLETLLAIEKERGRKLSAVVIGLPLRLQGNASVLSDEVRALVVELNAIADIPIILWDERFTTSMAERSLKEAGISRKNRTKSVDQVAAALVLQSYMDHANNF
jgi:RNAse H-fold protein YqgF